MEDVRMTPVQVTDIGVMRLYDDFNKKETKVYMLQR